MAKIEKQDDPYPWHLLEESDYPMISVVDMIREGQWYYTKKLAWSAGRAVSREWRKEHNCRPHYEMRAKTLGAGRNAPAHLKAVYPQGWRSFIHSIIEGRGGVRFEEEECHEVPCIACQHPAHSLGECMHCECGKNIKTYTQMSLGIRAEEVQDE